MRYRMETSVTVSCISKVRDKMLLDVRAVQYFPNKEVLSSVAVVYCAETK